MSTGKVRSVEALIYWNLDLLQLVHDTVEDAQDPRVPLSMLRILQKVSVLDPTCGSGAFLFSALNIIEALYDACLSRMDEFVAETQRGQTAIDESTLSVFRSELARVKEHPSRRYSVLKSSIVANLYGVDIMEEAVEICKL
ncbi:hypothetical protein B1B_15325, partial [mine drainage metagenome]